MRNFRQTNNPAFNAGNCVLAFNRRDTTVAELALLDRGCDSLWQQKLAHYESAVQSIRLIDCARRNTWAAQPKQWSAVVWGMDAEGQALLVFCRSPYTMHDLANLLLQSPLHIQQAMYLEGGPETSFYLNRNGVVRELFGSYETGFLENDDSRQPFPLPNVIGVVPK